MELYEIESSQDSTEGTPMIDSKQPVNLRDDASLKAALFKAAQTRPNARQLNEQRVSFVYGILGEKSTLTRDGVRDLLVQQGAITK
jgi:hypothetical protein